MKKLLMPLISGAVALVLIAGTALADEFFGTITKADAEAKTITVIEKESKKEVVLKVSDKTEYITKKGATKVDFEKLTKGIEKAQEKGNKGIAAKIEHEKKVATKIHVVAKKGDAPKKEDAPKKGAN